jgi:hypothetical protein
MGPGDLCRATPMMESASLELKLDNYLEGAVNIKAWTIDVKIVVFWYCLQVE